MRQWIRNLSDRSEFVLVTVVCFSYVIFGSMYALLSEIRRIDLTTTRVLRNIGIELLVLLLVAAVLRVRGWDLGRVGLRFSWLAAGAGVPLCMVYVIVYSLLSTVMLLAWPAATEVWAFRFTTPAPAILILLFLVLNSFFEEFAVAGYVITALSRHGAAVAVTVSTLVRLAYHLYQGPVGALSSIVMGVIFGAVFWRHRSLWPLVAAHTVANFLAFADHRGV